MLFTFLALGELIVWLTGIAVPSSILGMLLLTLSLKLRIVRLRHVDRIADFLTHNLGFFFVPAGVGLIGCLDLIAREWIPIAGAMVVSTAVILIVTGHTHQFVRKRMRKKGQAESTVHMLNWAIRSVKFLGVEFDKSEDEEVSVSDTTHL